MKKAPVSRRAVVQRVNRALSKEDQTLKASRGLRAMSDLGSYYIVSLSRNAILRKDVDVEKVGRQLGVLKPYERLAD